MLRAERERQGLGLDQIEAVTRIRATQLRAIEDDRLDALPAEAYARGFVRTYADQLAMDADATVHLFNEQWSRLNTFRSEQYPPLHPPVAAAGDAARPLAAISMVLARLGSSTGRLLVERTLAPGEAVRLRGRRIWLRLGDPTNVRLRLNGRSLELTPTADPINLLVTPHGAKAA